MSIPEADPAVDIISRLVPAILRALHALEFAGRHLSPATLIELVEAIGKRDAELAPALEASRDHAWPERLAPARACLERAAEAAIESIPALRAAPGEEQPVLAAYRALRGYARGAEALYPMAMHLRPVSQFFLESDRRDDAELHRRFAAVDPSRSDIGVMHIGGQPGTRGGASLYVPEYWQPDRTWPLIVAMHGGSGNGGAFLWSWLREARTRGAILLAPTAIGSTWSLMEAEVDGPNIDSMVEAIAGKWQVDRQRMLLTGMSDGGTFTYVLGMRAECRFTHLAPVAAAFHPMLTAFADAGRLRGLPVHIVHGAQDWMFPPEIARNAEIALRQAGADVVYREIEDLSHAYPRDENGAILDWFLGS